MTAKRLLLVEDDRALADLVAFHFERAGYEVTRTGDGEEALILVDEVKPDIILLDWMIEGISGIEVCRRLRRRATTANVPIMMLTAYADVEMDVAAHRVRRGGDAIALGPTEFRLLKHLLEHPGRVFSRERLLDTVWAHDPDIDTRTVDVHVRRLRQALNMGDRPDIIRTVRSAGYSLDSEA